MAGANPFPIPYPAATVQLAYQANFNQPGSGRQAENSRFKKIVTGINPNGILVFGCLVCVDTTVTTTLQGGIAQGVKHPASSGDLSNGIVGLVLASAAMETRRDTNPPSYQKNDVANIMRAGVLWTAFETATTVHGTVYVRVTANGSLSQLGALRGDNDGGNAILVANAYMMDASSQGTYGGYSRIDFNFAGQ